MMMEEEGVSPEEVWFLETAKMMWICFAQPGEALPWGMRKNM